MLMRGQNRRTRRGMTLVESALVLSIFLMLLFGIFEYCRFIMVMHITNNAARDGARYAAVNVNCSDATATQALIIQYTKDRMAGVSQNISGLAVAVYPCDSAGLSSSTPVLRSKSTTGSAPYPDPFGATPYTPWNNAAFTERIAVTIKGTYTPVLPTLLFMPTTIPIYVTAVT
jgi:Flp pilus assembly protein TadG